MVAYSDVLSPKTTSTTSNLIISTIAITSSTAEAVKGSYLGSKRWCLWASDNRLGAPFQSIEEMEHNMIIQALADADNNQEIAARRLGISSRTIRNKLRKYREG